MIRHGRMKLATIQTTNRIQTMNIKQQHLNYHLEYEQGRRKKECKIRLITPIITIDFTVINAFYCVIICVVATLTLLFINLCNVFFCGSLHSGGATPHLHTATPT